MLFTDSSQFTEQLFEALFTLNREEYFPYEKFEGTNVAFITHKFEVLAGFTAWIKHIYMQDPDRIVLFNNQDTKESKFYISVRTRKYIYNWNVQKSSSGSYTITEEKLNYNNINNEPRPIKTISNLYFYKFFTDEFPQRALSSAYPAETEQKLKTFSDVLALCDYVYVLMDTEGYGYDNDYYAKPLIENSDGNIFITVTVRTDLDFKYFAFGKTEFTEPFFARIARDDFEDILSRSKFETSLKVKFLSLDFNQFISASDVYSAIQKNKHAQSYLDHEVSAQINQKKKAKAKKISRIKFSIAALCIIVAAPFFGLYLTLRTPFVTKTANYLLDTHYGSLDAYRGFKKDVVIDENSKLTNKDEPIPHIIAENAFKGKDITSFAATAHVLFIEQEAFKDCSNLTRIKLNNGLRSIDSCAFENCPITEIEIPSTVYFLGKDILAGTNVKKITVGENVFKNCPDAFSGLVDNPDVEFSFTDDSAAFDPLTYVTFDSTGKAITDIFCPFEKLVIPEGVERLILGNYRNSRKDGHNFYREGHWSLKSNVKEIVLPQSLKNIEYYSFAYSPIKKLTIPSGIHKLSSNTFFESAIEEIELPETLEAIDFQCFEGSKIKNIVIPDSVTDLGIEAFENCKELETVVIGNNIIKIDYSTFAHCKSLKKVIIGKNVRTIEPHAFYDTGLESIVIPSTVKQIDPRAFPETTEIIYE